MHGTAQSAMNSFRLSTPSSLEETCSAEITVPWTTRMSSPASSAISCHSATFCGVNEPQATAPSALISSTRRAISSGLTGSA